MGKTSPSHSAPGQGDRVSWCRVCGSDGSGSVPLWSGTSCVPLPLGLWTPAALPCSNGSSGSSGAPAAWTLAGGSPSSRDQALCQPASLAHSMFTSGWGASPGPWGPSRPPAHSATATRTWGPVAAPWFHSKASDTAGTPPAEAPTGRGQHWS